MNLKKIARLRELIANQITDKQFDMGSFGAPSLMREGFEAAPGHGPHCGTAGCIAGWVAAMYAPKTCRDGVQDVAQKLLGLDERQANYLFCAEAVVSTLRKLTRQDAVRALDALVETGMPEWPQAVMDELWEEDETNPIHSF